MRLGRVVPNAENSMDGMTQLNLPQENKVQPHAVKGQLDQAYKHNIGGYRVNRFSPPPPPAVEKTLVQRELSNVSCPTLQ